MGITIAYRGGWSTPLGPRGERTISNRNKFVRRAI